MKISTTTNTQKRTVIFSFINYNLEVLTLWFVDAVLGSAQGSVIGGFLQSEGADDGLTEELSSADLLLPVLLLGHRLQQLPLRPQFHPWTKHNQR